MEWPAIKFKLLGTVTLGAVAIASYCLMNNSIINQSESSMFLASRSNLKSEKEAAFIKFIAEYGKVYASTNEVTSRFKIFSENYDKI